VLVDKPEGPSSFAIVAEIRRRTGARTGHAGTLDPFASGLLLVLSGAATKLASCFVGLDKRYVTDVDLTAAASAVKIGGERAYRLHRRGVDVEMPVRRSRVDSLDLTSYSDGVARLDLRVGSGTYVRSIAAVLGGHCATLRRTEVGPFRVAEADPERILPPEEALARIGVGGGTAGAETS
jgi:tRNA pseudouridine55 synthase